MSQIVEPEPDIQIPEYVYKRLFGLYRDKPIVSDPQRGDIAPTCVAHYSKDMSTRLLKDGQYPHGVRPYTPREYARLQGVPEWFQFEGNSSSIYKQVGNGVPIPIGVWVAEEISRYMSS